MGVTYKEEEEFWEMEKAAKHYNELQEIAKDFGEPLYYLYLLLENKYNSAKENKEKLEKLMERANRLREHNTSLRILYNELILVMTEEEQKRYRKCCVSERGSRKLTQSGKNTMDMDAPSQFLYQLLQDKFNQATKYEAELQTMLRPLTNVPNTFKNFWTLYNSLMPIMTADEREKFIECCVCEQESQKLTPAEKTELFWWALCMGPILTAYERKATCKFITRDGVESVYNGSDEDECRYYFEYLKAYYRPNFRVSSGQPEINRGIAVIDRIIENAPTLDNDTMLYRGVEDIYSEQELQSLKGLWGRNREPLLITDRATMSTSLTENSCYRHHKYVLEILAPAGTKGIYVDPNFVGYAQQEFLLPRNTTIKIYSIAYDDSTGNFVLRGKIVSQSPSNERKDEFSRGTNNVVDKLKLRRLSFDDAINCYNDQFNNSEFGTDVTQFMNRLIERGWLDKFYFEAYDMENLYEVGSLEQQDDLLVEYSQLVMLYAVYIGHHIELDDRIINLLIIAAKYHSVYTSSNPNELSNLPSTRIASLMNDLKLSSKYSKEDISIIAVLIEGCAITDDNEFIKILNKYRIPVIKHETITTALTVLKDAITLNGTRLPSGIDNRNLKNDISIGLVKTAYQIQEISGNYRLDANIRAGIYSEYELKQIERYRIQGVPEYIIFHALSTSIQGYNNIEEMINKWFSRAKSSHIR